MPNTPIEAAEQHLAAGRYAEALSQLQGANPLDPEAARIIREAADRMKAAADREFAGGRWTVAEGLVDAVREHVQVLSPEQREECDALLARVRSYRGRTVQADILLQGAVELAAQCRYRESREVALRILAGCDDAALVTRLRRLLMGLPHPLGGLAYGFDCMAEVVQFTETLGGAVLESVIRDDHPPGGGYARVVLPQGAAVVLRDAPRDWSAYREISFLVAESEWGPSRFVLRIGAPPDSWTLKVRVDSELWDLRRVKLAEFEKEGNPRWDAVTRVAIESCLPKSVEFLLDEIRIKPSSQ